MSVEYNNAVKNADFTPLNYKLINERRFEIDIKKQPRANLR